MGQHPQTPAPAATPAAFAEQPALAGLLSLASVAATVQRLGAMQLHGTLASGAVNATWHGQLKANGLQLDIQLPPTPVRDGYALFANAISELAVAQIDGTFALHASLSLPEKSLTLEPKLQGMHVQGLGTAQWANARRTRRTPERPKPAGPRRDCRRRPALF